MRIPLGRRKSRRPTSPFRFSECGAPHRDESDPRWRHDWRGGNPDSRFCSHDDLPRFGSSNVFDRPVPHPGHTPWPAPGFHYEGHANDRLALDQETLIRRRPPGQITAGPRGNHSGIIVPSSGGLRPALPSRGGRRPIWPTAIRPNNGRGGQVIVLPLHPDYDYEPRHINQPIFGHRRPLPPYDVDDDWTSSAYTDSDDDESDYDDDFLFSPRGHSFDRIRPAGGTRVPFAFEEELGHFPSGNTRRPWERRPRWGLRQRGHRPNRDEMLDPFERRDRSEGEREHEFRSGRRR